MVEENFINKVREEISNILLKELNARVEIMIFFPMERNYPVIKYNLIIASSDLDNISIRKIVNLIFTNLRSTLNIEEQQKIYQIDVLKTNENLINNLKFVYPIFNELILISNTRIGNLYIEKAYLFKVNI